MKIKYLITFFFLLLICTTGAKAAPYSNLDVDMFVGDGCPHCAKMEAYITEQQRNNYPNMNIHIHEIYHDTDNQRLFQRYSQVFDFSPNGVPVTVIGNTAIEGEDFKALDEQLKYCETNTCPNPALVVDNYFQGREPSATDKSTDIDTTKYQNAGWVVLIVTFVVAMVIMIVSFKNKEKK